MYLRRRDLILNELERLSKGIETTDLMNGYKSGFDAELIGNNLGIARNTVSKELTSFCEEGLVIKIKSRPVLYIHKEILERLLNCKIDIKDCEIKEIEEILRKYYIKSETAREDSGITDPFNKLIGYNASLQDAIEKAKAAVFYPPNGLHIMLTGQSGVGKTYFAEIINEAARQNGLIKKDKPLVYFNCSEYYNNPELLTAHLFGHEAGAYTGAIGSRDGIIKKADGGFLMLDEIHRLPAEGQEKLFSVLDKGTYRKLGSSEKEERINIRLICATTEDIKSNLLKTFLRRIQVVIDLPSLKEKAIDERMELIYFFLEKESQKINLEIRTSKEYIYQFLVRDFEANIGEIKSEIQFNCAQAYVKKIHNKADYLLVDESYIKQINTKNNIIVRNFVNEIFGEEDYIIIHPNQSENITTYLNRVSEENELDIFYSYILEEYTSLRNSNVPLEETVALLENKLETIFHYGTNNSFEVKNNRYKEYGYKLEDKIKILIGYIEELLGFHIESKIISELSAHILSLIAFVNKGSLSMMNVMKMDSYKTKEYENARKICKKIEAVFNISCPNTELIYMNLFIKKLKSKKVSADRQRECGVLLIAHGNSTATSMADFANSIYEQNVIEAIDMPIDQPAHAILDVLIRKIEKDAYKKVILLVDIGSLVYFGDIISKRFGMETLLVKNASTITVLEMAREVIYEPLNFERIRDKFLDMNMEIELFDGKPNNRSKVLIISCITGMGTSVKIKEFLDEILKDYVSENIRLCVVDYGETESLKKISSHVGKEEKIAGVIGTFMVEVPDIPFISLDELFTNEGIEKLTGLLGLGNSAEDRKDINADLQERFIRNLSLEGIIDYVTFLNPQRVMNEIRDVYDKICNALNNRFSQQIQLRFLVHCCCMVERIVVNREPLQIPEETTREMGAEMTNIIRDAFRVIEETYDIELTSGEIYYIYELLFS